MSRLRILCAVWIGAGLASSPAALAQVGGGAPATPGAAGASAIPAAPGAPEAPLAPGARKAGRVRAVKPDATLPDAKMRALPRPTAAERAEKRKLDHDLKICIGC